MAAQTISSKVIFLTAKAQFASERPATDLTVEQLVHDYAQTVYRVAYSVLRDHHDAEDAAQETFIRVVKQKEKLKEVREPKTWLVKIAWRMAVNKANSRREGHVTSIDEGSSVAAMLQDKTKPADEVAASSQMSALMGRLIAGLPEELRQTLELSCVKELNSVQIAEILEIPEGSVRTRLMRARAILKEKLQALGARP
jgi:RNA polymerase sigma-70 factor (ECF subfamily)